MQEKEPEAKADKHSNSSVSVEKHSHQRKLLSLETPVFDGKINDAQKEDNLNKKTVSEDEIFLADWIANTKQKHLSWKIDQSESLNQPQETKN